MIYCNTTELGGDLDINFFLQAPDGKVLISESGKTDAAHK
jgi:hypothetical protein